MTGQPHDILVVGGGIGGLAAALALARTGRQVLVAEQAPRFAEIGAGLQLGPNATRAFDQLGVLGQILDAAVLPARAVVRDAVTGEELTVLDLGRPFRERYGYPYVVAHRHDVLSALLNACFSSSSRPVMRRSESTRKASNAARNSFSCERGSGWRSGSGAVGAGVDAAARSCWSSPSRTAILDSNSLRCCA